LKYIYRLYYYILFKIKDPKEVRIHPRYNKHIKYGFSTGGRHYYRFSHDYDIFENRFSYLKTFYQEVENKLTSQDINDFADAIIERINTSKLIEAGELAKELKYRSEWLFEPTSLFKYASVIYFDLQEDVTDYDVDYNHDKIRFWSKKKELLQLLLKELMSGAESLLALSKDDFINYLSQLQEKKDKQQTLISEAKPTKDNSIREEQILEL